MFSESFSNELLSRSLTILSFPASISCSRRYYINKRDIWGPSCQCVYLCGLVSAGLHRVCFMDKLVSGGYRTVVKLHRFSQSSLRLRLLIRIYLERRCCDVHGLFNVEKSVFAQRNTFLHKIICHRPKLLRINIFVQIFLFLGRYANVSNGCMQRRESLQKRFIFLEKKKQNKNTRSLCQLSQTKIF